MRLIVIKQASNSQFLGSKLCSSGSESTGKAAAGNSTLERIKSLNPHVDFQRIEAGTVLLLPDSPELEGSETQSVVGDAFADFSSHLGKGLQAAAQRARSAAEALSTDRTAVAAVLETPAVKLHVRTDPLLQQQLDDASKAFTAEQEKAQTAAKQAEAMRAAVAKELEALAGLLR